MLTAEQIAAALAGKPDAADLGELITACSTRRDWIRARLTAMTGTRSQPSPARLEAVRSGPAAMRAFDAESDALGHEQQYLDAIERLIYEAQQTARVEAARRAVPAAARALPAKITALRKALGEVDAALAQLNACVAQAGEYDAAGLPFPMSDDALAELYGLRDDVWRTRTVGVLIPPPVTDDPIATKFPKSWGLAYVTENRAGLVRRQRTADDARRTAA